MEFRQSLWSPLLLVILWMDNSFLAFCQDGPTAASPIEITNSIGMKLVQIPSGRFSMGSPTSEEGSRDDETLHKVEISHSFHLATTEVTERQWALVMEPAMITESIEERDPKTKRFIRNVEQQRPNPRLNSQRPVVKISWEDACKFCQQLSELPEEKKEKRVYRLPTEAEWEYGCRAGASTAFCFGDNKSDLRLFGWYRDTTAWTYDAERFPQWLGRVQEVGKIRPNAWGLHDMHGNVAEWCADRYAAYESGLVVDSLKEPEGNWNRVVRGGHINHQPDGCRSAARYSEPPGISDRLIGFRIACDQ
jgi:formylglycine-generating enzyme required for sulfatase activity